VNYPKAILTGLGTCPRMFSTQHKKSPVRVATLPPPSQSTQPLSPPDCGTCDTAPCLSDCDCDDCIDEATPGFAPGETIDLDEITMTLLEFEEVKMFTHFINVHVDNWERQLRGLSKAPRGHHVVLTRALKPNSEVLPNE